MYEIKCKCPKLKNIKGNEFQLLNSYFACNT